MKARLGFALVLTAAALLLWIACSGVGSAPSRSSGGTPSTAAVTFIYVANGAANTISGFQLGPGNALVPLSGSPFTSSGSVPGRMAADRAGRFLFVVNQLSSSVSSYTINRSTGLLFPAHTALTAGAPVAVALHPTASFVYVANAGTGTVSAFRFDTNGTMTELAGSPYGLLTSTGGASSPNAQDLTIDSTGHFLFAINAAGITTFQINGDGTLLRLGLTPAGATPVAIAADPAASLVYSLDFGTPSTQTGDVLGFTIATNGVLLNAGAPTATGVNPVTIAIDPAGKFVLVGAGTSGNGVINVFQINSSTGFLTQTPGAPFASTPNPVQFAFDPAGSLLFVANAGTSTTGTVPGNITEFSIGANGFLTPAPGGQVTTASPSGLALVHFAP